MNRVRFADRASQLIVCVLFVSGLLLFPQRGFADSPIIDQVSELLRRQLDPAQTKLVVEKETLRSATMLARFYEKRAYRPAWSDDAALSAQADALIEMIHTEAEREGLPASDERLEKIRGLLNDLRQTSAPEPQALANVDLLLSDIFLTYGAQVALGKTKLRRLDADWFVQQQRADLVEVLQQAVTENRIAETVKSLPPQHPGYAKLRDALVRYRHLAARGGWPTIPEGGALRPGDHDARVPQLRARLQVTGEFTAPPAPSGRSRRPARVPAGDPTFYDPALVRAAKKFQQRHGLQLDGVIGGNSLAALNVSVETRVQQVMVNMHRWRALPPNLGARHIDVNIPDFTLSVSEHDHPVLTMKVVVGKMLEEHSTPTFSAQMTYLVLNPYWYVPKNIAEKELFPQSRKDPHYFAKNNFVLRRVAVNEKKTADPNAVADAPPSAKTYQYLLRQEPGPKNALGRVKFMFPNDYGVYLHDTPAKELFRRVVRTFSHGCIRIEKPIELAEYLLRDSGQWPRDAILAKLEEQKQKTVWLPEALPVYIQYWTAWVDDDGVTQFRNDIYGYDNVPGAQLPVKTPQPQPAASAPEVHPSSPREQSPPAPAPAETSVEPRRQDPEPSVVN